jgi:hypothetical protein
MNDPGGIRPCLYEFLDIATIRGFIVLRSPAAALDQVAA